MNSIQLQTKVKIPNPGFKLGINTTFCSLGSCFADHLYNFFFNTKFQINHNPYGITYNPVSISKTVLNSLNNYEYSHGDLIHHEDLYHSMDHHGKFSGPNSEHLIGEIQHNQDQFQANLRIADVLIITLGTANVFKMKPKYEIVNNCHKLPADKFLRERLTIQQITTNLTRAFQKVWDLNPSLQIVLSISPVRHIRDGLVENQKSKATLLLAVDELLSAFSKVSYFPAYEICLDELRDYRFYQEDMVHPTKQTVNYIIESFILSHFEMEAIAFLKEIGSLKKSIEHRPLHPNRTSHQQFLQKILDKIQHLEDQYPSKDFDEEKQEIIRRIKN